jgi:predicted O-linked N-acetylglucosamine transferase (SPINDLY family)
VSRAGVTILHALDLPRFIAHTPDEYVQIAASVAADPPALAAIRKTLRDRMSDSGLTDGRGAARRIEAAYDAIWRDGLNDIC